MRDQVGRVCRPGRAQRGPGGFQQSPPLHLRRERRQSPEPHVGAGRPGQRGPRGRLRRPGAARLPLGGGRHVGSRQKPLRRLETRSEESGSFPAGASVPPGDGLRASLHTEHARPVGTAPHSLGGPAAAEITDKLTYKESFYFVSKPQRLTAELPAAEASPARARAPLSRGETRPRNAREEGGRQGPALAAREHLDAQEPVPKLPCGCEVCGVTQSCAACTPPDRTCGPESRGISATQTLASAQRWFRGRVALAGAQVPGPRSVRHWALGPAAAHLGSLDFHTGPCVFTVRQLRSWSSPAPTHTHTRI